MLLTPPSPAVRICFWRFQSSRHLTFWYDGSFCIHSGGPVHYSFLLKVSGGAIHMADEKKDLVEKVKQIMAEQLWVDEGEVTPSASFVDGIGADSLANVELVMALEEAFGVEAPDEDAGQLRTLPD